MMSEHSVSTVNVVASSSTGREIDLDELARDMSPVSYDPEDFPGLVYRVENPEVSTLLFSSGKIVATGAEAIQEAEDAINKVFEDLRNLGIEVEDNEVVIQNIVNSASLDSRLNLNAVAIGLGVENVEYEPEQFPGLIYRLDNPDVCVLLFGSGEVVLSGAGKDTDSAQVIERVENELETLNLI